MEANIQNRANFTLGGSVNGRALKQDVQDIARHVWNALLDQKSIREIEKMPDWLLHDLGLTRSGLKIGPDGLPIANFLEGGER